MSKSWKSVCLIDKNVVPKNYSRKGRNKYERWISGAKLNCLVPRSTAKNTGCSRAILGWRRTRGFTMRGESIPLVDTWRTFRPRREEGYIRERDRTAPFLLVQSSTVQTLLCGARSTLFESGCTWDCGCFPPRARAIPRGEERGGWSLREKEEREIARERESGTARDNVNVCVVAPKHSQRTDGDWVSSGCTGRMDSCRGYVELVALCGDYLNEPPLISKLFPSLSVFSLSSL